MNLPHIDHWIDGQAAPSPSAERLTARDPEDDAALATLPRGNPADVDAAVAAAAGAWQKHGCSGPSQRESVLLRAAELLQGRRDQFRELLIREIGSPASKAELEIDIASGLLKAYAGIPRQMTGRSYPTDQPGCWSVAFRRPLGVVAAITPFNVPLIKGIKHCSMPLATGNTVVWLPSEQAPQLAQHVARLFADAGLPAGALNVVFGRGSEIGDHLVTHPQVRAVGFTGSQSVGRHVQALCGRHGKRVTLELGGKNPLIVLEDADLPAAVAAAVKGGFLYQGQICMASSRVLVARERFDAFSEAFVAAASNLGCGSLDDPATVIGPIIHAAARQRIRETLSEAVERGARVLCGNRWHGNRLAPTVLSGIEPSMRLSAEEIFAPVVSVEAVRDREDALERAAASGGMLSAAVFSNDLSAAMEFCQRLPTAMVHVNDMTIQQQPEVPFGGDGDVGFGREGMQTGIDDYTRWQWVSLRGGGSAAR